MARAFLESLEVDFDPERYADEYRDQLAALIERKSKEGDVAEQPEHEVEPERTPADDIIAALEASLAAQRDGKAKPKARAKGKARSASR
jgi:DNA end-binding protein Ku